MIKYIFPLLFIILCVKLWPTSKYIKIDNDFIDKAKYFGDIIEPLNYYVEVTKSHKDYLTSLRSFSKEQRLVYALDYYLMEVNNGGHEQFLYNSSGIVWMDVKEGLRVVGSKVHLKLYVDVIKRLGSEPSFIRDQRIKQLGERYDLFEDLDTKFYNSDEDVYQMIYDYIVANKSKFYFEGSVK